MSEPASTPKKRNWVLRHKVWSALIALLVLLVIAGISGGNQTPKTPAAAVVPSVSPSAPTSPPQPTVTATVIEAVTPSSPAAVVSGTAPPAAPTTAPPTVVPAAPPATVAVPTTAPARAVTPPTVPATSAPPAAPAVTCSASMSNSQPSDYHETDVLVTTSPDAAVDTVAHYKTTSTEHTGAASSTGHADIPYYISRATPGYQVVVDVTVDLSGRTGSCSTSFTPQ